MNILGLRIELLDSFAIDFNFFFIFWFNLSSWANEFFSGLANIILDQFLEIKIGF